MLIATPKVSSARMVVDAEAGRLVLRRPALGHETLPGARPAGGGQRAAGAVVADRVSGGLPDGGGGQVRDDLGEAGAHRAPGSCAKRSNGDAGCLPAVLNL